jgi:hypothetical protein
MERENQNNQSNYKMGYSMVNVLSNIAYAGMRAQGSQDRFARFASFVFGFPGTLLTYFVVDDGSERAYGVDLPRRQPKKTVDI